MRVTSDGYLTNTALTGLRVGDTGPPAVDNTAALPGLEQAPHSAASHDPWHLLAGLPTWEEIAASAVVPLEGIPRDARTAVANALGRTLERAVTEETFRLVAMFAKAVLAPTRRGGDTAAVLRARCRRWMSGGFSELWQEVRHDPRAPQPSVAAPEPGASPASALLPLPRQLRPLLDPDTVEVLSDPVRRRIVKTAEKGEYSRAMRQLNVTSVLGASPEVLTELIDSSPVLRLTNTES